MRGLTESVALLNPSNLVRISLNLKSLIYTFALRAWFVRTYLLTQGLVSLRSAHDSKDRKLYKLVDRKIVDIGDFLYTTEDKHFKAALVNSV